MHGQILRFLIIIFTCSWIPIWQSHNQSGWRRQEAVHYVASICIEFPLYLTSPKMRFSRHSGNLQNNAGTSSVRISFLCLFCRYPFQQLILNYDKGRRWNFEEILDLPIYIYLGAPYFISELISRPEQTQFSHIYSLIIFDEEIMHVL